METRDGVCVSDAGGTPESRQVEYAKCPERGSHPVEFRNSGGVATPDVGLWNHIHGTDIDADDAVQ